MYHDNFSPTLRSAMVILIPALGCAGHDRAGDTAPLAQGADTASLGPGYTSPCGAIPADDDGYVDLFDTARVHTVSLTLTDADAAALAADPGDWVHADLVIDGQAFPGVGVHWRGDATQERWDAKPGFKIDLRAFDACATLAGLSRLTLDGQAADPAQGRQVVASAVFAAAGLAVSHAAWTTLDVNGTPFGLYTNVETVDGAFVAHHFDDPGGVLWEGGEGADFTGRGLSAWDDVDSNGTGAALAAVAAVVQGPADDFYTPIRALVDMDELFTLWGMRAAIGEGGGYPYDTDDVYVYVAPADGVLRFVPWNIDAGWDPTFAWDRVQTALGTRCYYDPACRGALDAHIDAALRTTEGLDVAALAQAAFALSAGAVAADPRRSTALLDVEAARATLVTTMAAWPATLRAQLGR